MVAHAMHRDLIPPLPEHSYRREAHDLILPTEVLLGYAVDLHRAQSSCLKTYSVSEDTYASLHPCQPSPWMDSMEKSPVKLRVSRLQVPRAALPHGVDDAVIE